MLIAFLGAYGARAPGSFFFFFFPGSSYREFGVRLAPFQVMNGGTRVKSVISVLLGRVHEPLEALPKVLPVYAGVVDRNFPEQEAQSS